VLLAQAEHMAAFEVAEKVPASHDAQVRSRLAVPGSETYEPAAQSVQAAHDVAPAADQVLLAQAEHMAAFEVAEKVPASHDAQVRSRLAVPASETYEPAAQVLHGAHEAALLAVL
jgi:hypothetical protein